MLRPEKERKWPWSLFSSHYLHRHTNTCDLFHPWQAASLANSHLALSQLAYGMSEKLISSLTTTDRPCDRRTDSQNSVNHISSGALSQSQTLNSEVGRERRREGEPDDDSKLTGSLQMCRTLQPNKSFTLGNRFVKVCVV